MIISEQSIASLLSEKYLKDSYQYYKENNMRIKQIDLHCPKCKTAPKIIKTYIKGLMFGKVEIQLKCKCGTAEIVFKNIDSISIADALGAWLKLLDQHSAFDEYNRIIRISDLNS